MSGVHANTAVVLRMLAASPQPEFFSRLTDEGVRLVLKLAAEAFEHLDEVELGVGNRSHVADDLHAWVRQACGYGDVRLALQALPRVPPAGIRRAPPRNR